MMLRVSLAGACMNAFRCIETLMDELQRRMDEQEWEDFCTHHQPGVETGMLKEITKHARETAAGEHTIEEFAEFYCLREPAA